MSKFCKTHCKERTDNELKLRFAEIKNRARAGQTLGPGIQREMKNIQEEWGRRNLGGDEEMFK